MSIEYFLLVSEGDYGVIRLDLKRILFHFAAMFASASYRAGGSLPGVHPKRDIEEAFDHAVFAEALSCGSRRGFSCPAWRRIAAVVARTLAWLHAQPREAKGRGFFSKLRVDHCSWPSGSSMRDGDLDGLSMETQAHVFRHDPHPLGEARKKASFARAWLYLGRIRGLLEEFEKKKDRGPGRVAPAGGSCASPRELPSRPRMLRRGSSSLHHPLPT